MSDVRTLLASVLQVPPHQLSEDDGMETLPQWDSLKTLLIASMAEVTWGITLSSSEIDRLTSVRAVRAVLAGHGVSA
jgi:acyl carrier protein